MKVKQEFLNGVHISDDVIYDIFVTGYFSPEEILEDKKDQRIVRLLIQRILDVVGYQEPEELVQTIHDHPVLIEPEIIEFIDIIEDNLWIPEEEEVEDWEQDVRDELISTARQTVKNITKLVALKTVKHRPNNARTRRYFTSSLYVTLEERIGDYINDIEIWCDSDNNDDEVVESGEFYATLYYKVGNTDEYIVVDLLVVDGKISVRDSYLDDDELKYDISDEAMEDMERIFGFNG